MRAADLHNENEYEASYLRDVLRFEEGATEEDIDDRLIAEAKELGISIEPKRSMEYKRPMSMPVLPTGPRRPSIDSRTSVAASVVSNSSAASSVQQYRNRRSMSRASLSFRDHDTFLARGRPGGRASISFSPPKTPSASTSAFSLALSSPESSPKKHYRLMRGLSMLKLSRTDSAMSSRRCPHCPRDAASERRAVHKLPCGHRLCTQALRDTINAAATKGDGTVPSYCGIPIPAYLVEHVASQQNQDVIMEKLGQARQPASQEPLPKNEPRETIGRPGALAAGSRTVSDESKVDSVAPESKKDAETVEKHPEHEQLKPAQAALQVRFLTWISAQRAALEVKHGNLRKEMKAAHEAATENLEEHHLHAVSEAEDKQVKAEADMRSLHAQEKRDSATALKHMEAYCAGTYVSTGEPHDRTVTEQDRAELENARKNRDGMPSRHRSAINVLRGEQARRLRLREQRQEKAAQELRRCQRQEELELERRYTEDMRRFEEFVDGRMELLKRRWNLEDQLAARRVELQSATEGASDLSPSIQQA